MKTLSIPAEISQALPHVTAVSISISGGKDSQAMQRAVMAQVTAPRFDLVHADLGRAEWPQTPQFVERMGLEVDLPVNVVQRVKGDLVQRIEERLDTVSTIDGTKPAKPFWPSAAQRYCTSDLKRGTIQKH